MRFWRQDVRRASLAGRPFGERWSIAGAVEVMVDFTDGRIVVNHPLVILALRQDDTARAIGFKILGVVAIFAGFGGKMPFLVDSCDDAIGVIAGGAANATDCRQVHEDSQHRKQQQDYRGRAGQGFIRTEGDAEGREQTVVGDERGADGQGGQVYLEVAAKTVEVSDGGGTRREASLTLAALASRGSFRAAQVVIERPLAQTGDRARGLSTPENAPEQILTATTRLHDDRSRAGADRGLDCRGVDLGKGRVPAGFDDAAVGDNGAAVSDRVHRITSLSSFFMLG